MIHMSPRSMWLKKGVHAFFVIIFCVLSFFAGIRLYDTMKIYFQLNSPVHDVEFIVSSEVAIETVIDPLIVAVAGSKDVIDRELKPFINTDNPEDLSSVFKKKKQSIIDAYIGGQRDQQTIQLRLYLASLEGDNQAYQKISDEWCQKTPEECTQIKMSVLAHGQVLDESGSPIIGARLFFSGEEKNFTQTDNQGYYNLTLLTLHPRRLRLIVQHPEFSGGSYTFVTLDPRLIFGEQSQAFKKDFTLAKPKQESIINTSQKKVISGPAKVVKDGYVIENEFSKYLIPFDAIRTSQNKVYKGKVTIRVFEFDRKTANEFLKGDVFSDVYDFASEGLQTYSMPLIFFLDDTGSRLEVFREKPMIIWTTNRELRELVLENAQGDESPGFNPAQYEEATSPENVEKYIRADEMKAYETSQKTPDTYPITLDWIYKNYSRLPGFFVYDHSTGLWESIGYSLVVPSTETKHSIRSQFWTKI